MRILRNKYTQRLSANRNSCRVFTCAFSKGHTRPSRQVVGLSNTIVQRPQTSHASMWQRKALDKSMCAAQATVDPALGAKLTSSFKTVGLSRYHSKRPAAVTCRLWISVQLLPNQISVVACQILGHMVRCRTCSRGGTTKAHVTQPSQS